MRFKHAILAALLCLPSFAMADYDTLLSDGNLVARFPCTDTAESTVVTNTVGNDAAITAGGPNADDITTTAINSFQTAAFNLDDERIDFDANLQFTGSFAVAFWSNRTDTAAIDTVVASVADDRIALWSNGTELRLVIDGTAYILTHGVDTTESHHFVVIYRAGDDTIDLIVDGAEADVDNAGPSSLDWNLLRFAVTSSSTNFFGGQLSDIFIFDRDLSLAEAQDLYNGPSTGGDPNPLTPTLPGGTPDPLKRILP